MTRMFRVVMLALALGLSAARPAIAGDESEAAATVLFDESVRLMDQGQYAEACSKLARSQELAPSGGTLLNLAHCYEKNGQRASAWQSYKDAAERASVAKKRDMEKLARKAEKRLEPTLAKLMIVVREPVEGLEIHENDRPVPRSEIGVMMPIDPGQYRIVASAPGRKRWETALEVADNPATLTIEIPSLQRDTPVAPAPAPIAPIRREPPQSDAKRSSGSAQRAVGIGFGVGGLIGLGVGAYFGLQAKSENDDAALHCRTETRCDATGIDLDGQARRAATVSTVAFAAGAGLLSVGAVLYLTAPRRPATIAAFRVERSGEVNVVLGRSF
jgi:hypothetical protein